MNYTIILPDEDRQAIAAALGKLVQALTNAAPVIDSPPADATKNYYGAGAQASTASTPSLPSPADPPRASQQNPSVEARDRWATDKNGNPWKLESRGVRAIDVHIWKTENKPHEPTAFLHVTWQNSNIGYGHGNCFDSDLWPWIIKQIGHLTRLYVTKSGNYTNIVGVRA